jgi:diacylglycerol kinase (ATP)
VNLLVIVNPIAGQSRPGGLLPEIERCLGELAEQLQIRVTDRHGAALEIAAGVAPGQHDAIIAVGGDGTINEVINGIGVDVPLGIIPLGTANVLARVLKIPVNDIPGACRIIQEGQIRPMDLGLVNGRRFTLMTGIGFDAAVVQDVVQEVKDLIGAPAYLLAALGTLTRYEPTRLVLETDDRRVDTTAYMAVVCNVPTYAFMEVAPLASIDDGCLDVCVFEQRNRAEFVRQALAVLTRRHLHSNDVRYFRARRLRVLSFPPVGLQVDGDPGGDTPAEFRVLPGALRIFRPALQEV